MKVLVLGGNGFIGSNIVAALKNKKIEVLIGSRNVTKRQAAQTNMRQVVLHKLQNTEDWLPILQGVDFVVNSVGILRERRKESYNQVHALAPEALADACAALNVKLIHISAIGLTDNAKSGFIRSKYWGEQAILNSGAMAIIVRASLLDGTVGNGGAGYGAKWFRRVARWPVQCVMQSDDENQGVVAPLQVTDLGEAIANLCQMNFEKLPKVMELGGNKVVTIAQYLQSLRASYQQKVALQIAVPAILVRIVSHIFDVFAITPLSFGHFELMQGYNAPAMNMLPVLLGRRPSEVGANFEAKTALFGLPIV